MFEPNIFNMGTKINSNTDKEQVFNGTMFYIIITVWCVLILF